MTSRVYSRMKHTMYYCGLVGYKDRVNKNTKKSYINFELSIMKGTAVKSRER